MKEQTELKNYISGYNIPVNIDIPENAQDIFILCHGFGGNKDNPITKVISDELTKNRIGTIAFDFPSHGMGCSEIEKFTVDNCISDINVINQFLKEKFPKSNISLFASSFGAYIAINSFVNGGECFKYVILKSPAVNMKEVLIESLLKEKFEEYQKKGIAKAGHNGKIQVPYSFYIDLKEHDILQKLPNLKQKMLIFHGTADNTARIEDTERFSELNKNFVRLIKILNADHKIDMEDVKKIINYIVNPIQQKQPDRNESGER